MPIDVKIKLEDYVKNSYECNEIEQKKRSFLKEKSFKELNRQEQISVCQLNKKLMELYWSCFKYKEENQDYQGAIEYFVKAQEMGFRKAQEYTKGNLSSAAPIEFEYKHQFDKGVAHILGLGVPQCNRIARDCFLKINDTDEKYAYAQWYLGRLCDEGPVGINCDEKDARIFYIESAKKFFLPAINSLGRLLFYGFGGPQDKSRAMDYFFLAARQGYVTAQCNLGALFIQDQNFLDDTQAIEWFTLAAEQGLADAQYELGRMIYLENGDRAIARNWLKLAAEQHYAPAQYAFGKTFYDDEGFIPDLTQAIHWFTLAAKQNFSAAQYVLFQIFYYGTIEPNKKIALEWLKSAVSEGLARAQFDLGVMCYKGVVGTPDKARALDLFALSADQNYAKGQYNLGIMYYKKEMEDVVDSDKKARMWITLAANQGLVNAQCILGLMWEQGIGGDVNTTEARYWYRLAADQNYPAADEKLKQLDDKNIEFKETREKLTSRNLLQNLRKCLLEIKNGVGKIPSYMRTICLTIGENESLGENEAEEILKKLIVTAKKITAEYNLRMFYLNPEEQSLATALKSGNKSILLKWIEDKKLAADVLSSNLNG